MVVPLHSQQDWMSRLADLPPFLPGSEPIVLLSPHPDDETLSTGGLLASQCERRIPVKLIAVTDGENAYAENTGLAVRRTDEQTNAAAHLGIGSHDIVRLHLADSGVTGQLDELFEQLLQHVSAETHLVAPWAHDFHPDHEACGRAAIKISQQLGCRLTFYFFWTWHRGTPYLLKNLQLQAFPLTQEQYAAKAKALASHVSQLSHLSGDPILHPEHLWPAQLPFEIYLPS